MDRGGCRVVWQPRAAWARWRMDCDEVRLGFNVDAGCQDQGGGVVAVLALHVMAIQDLVKNSTF